MQTPSACSSSHFRRIVTHGSSFPRKAKRFAIPGLASAITKRRRKGRAAPDHNNLSSIKPSYRNPKLNDAWCVALRNFWTIATLLLCSYTTPANRNRVDQFLHRGGRHQQQLRLRLLNLLNGCDPLRFP